LSGVRPALEALKARKIARVVVSNSDGSVEHSLRRAGLRDLIDQVVDSHVVGHEKPDPAIFEHALAISGADRERTLHVGDMYAADVCGARAAGLAAVLLDPHGDWGPTDCPKAVDLLDLVQAAWPTT
jgi:putative hydrolase of the HAD superfamily